MTDPSPPPPGRADDANGDATGEVPAVVAATSVAADLRADAARLEAEGVGRAEVRMLARAGLYAVTGPAELGGVPLAAQRRVAELLAGASPDAWFVWFQHGPVVAMLAGVPETATGPAGRRRWLAPLCAGTATAGVAFSHLRSPRATVTARRGDGGWVLSGSQPWCTGWGLVDVILAGAQTDDGRVVLGLVPARPGAGLTARPLALSVMGGTSTVALHLQDVLLPHDSVVVLRTRQEWDTADGQATANTQPSTFGVALAALDALAPLAPGAEQSLRQRVLAVRASAYALIDGAAPGERVAERVALRAQALRLTMASATALLVATGGRGVGDTEVAQRLLRAASFQLVHAQTGVVRAATLDALVAAA